MKQFLLFCGMSYDPLGGWGDFKGSFDTMLEALAEHGGDWFQVVDLQTGKIVWDSSVGRY